MPDEAFYIEGLTELIETLSKRAPQEFHKAATVAMRKSVIDVTRWAKGNAPVDTGRMRSSIANRVRPTFGNISGYVGTNVTHRGFSYPTRMEEPGPVRGVGRRPWLRPAVEEHVKDILGNFNTMFRRLFKRMGF
jgi:hypothetical protein